MNQLSLRSPISFFALAPRPLVPPPPRPPPPPVLLPRPCVCACVVGCVSALPLARCMALLAQAAKRPAAGAAGSGQPQQPPAKKRPGLTFK